VHPTLNWRGRDHSFDVRLEIPLTTSQPTGYQREYEDDEQQPREARRAVP
jgi:hypothetical protein